MKKQILWLAALLLSAGSATDGFAQSGVKYPYATSEGSTSGKTSVIVSRDSKGGVKTSYIHANWKASTMPVHYENEAANAVSARFEVASADLGDMTWDEAIAGCAGYTQSGTSAGDWRMPTQREIMLIYVMHKQQGFLSSSWFYNEYEFYWSSTEDSTNGGIMCCISFESGESYGCDNGDSEYIRCVRDF